MAAVERASPNIIAPEAKRALEKLRTAHNAFQSLFAAAPASTREGLRTGIEALVASATVVGLVAAAKYLAAMGPALLNEFGWSSRIVPYLQSLL